MAKKPTFEEVKAVYDERGYTLLSDGYISAHSPLKYRCPNGHESQSAFNDFKRGRSCKFCQYDNYRTSYEEINKNFEKRGYFLISKSDDYKTVDTKLDFICPSGHRGSISYHSFKGGRDCFECGLEKNKRENHHKWNHDISDQEREDKRKGQKYSQFVSAVFARDNYTCVSCGQRGGELAAHHKDAYHWCEERRFDLTNSVTLCESCHRKFHNENGYKNNTEEQFKRWFLRAHTSIFQ